MRVGLQVVVSLSVLGACHSGDTGATAALVGSEAEPAAPAVVAIVDLSRSGLCTGSVVAPRVVLTAKHCVQPPDASGPNPPEDFRVVVGERVAEPERTFEVAAVATTPGEWGLNGAGGTTGALIGVDVAVLTLTEDSGITPLPFRRERVRGIVATELVAFGYGETPEGGNAEKRRASTRVDSMTSQVILTDAVVCSGDSGGPLVHADGDIVGVASLGPSTCGDGPGVFNTIHFFIDLIDAASDVPTDAGPDADGGLDGAVDASDATPDGGDAALTDVGDDGARDVAPDASVGGGGGCTSVTERPIGSAGWLSLFALLVLRIRRRVSAVHVLFHTC